MNSVQRVLRRRIVLPEHRPIEDWAHEHVDFGRGAAYKGQYDVRNVPQTREILRACKDPLCREITAVMPPQESGKTVAAEVYLCYRIAVDPAKMAYNTRDNVKAGKWYDTRWQAMMDSCPPVGDKFSDNRNDKQKKRIIFRDRTFLLIQGAEVDANRNSDTIEVQVNDEVHLWQRPWLKEMKDRLKAYWKKRKVINISTGGAKGSELEDAWLAGSQSEWCHRCPNCRKPFEYVFDRRKPLCNIRFDLAKVVTHADGRMDLREFAQTVYVECPSCGHRMAYDEERLERMNAEGLYVPKNPEALPELVSLHCNAFALGKRPWSEILEPWVRMSVRGGIFAMEIQREFITKELAEFYEDKPIIVPTELKLANYRRADVLAPKAWADEWIRVMAVDNQRGGKGDIQHRWFAAVAMNKPTASGRVKVRLVDAGRIDEWSAVKAKQQELGISEPTDMAPGPWVVVDRRFDPVGVDEVCSRYHWHGLLGHSSEEFEHGPNSPFCGVKQLFSEPRYIDTGFGTGEQGRTFAIYFLWSSQKVQDIVAGLRNTGEVEFPSDLSEWCPQMAEHMASHRSTLVEDTKAKGQEKRVWEKISGWPDHLYDCICMATVCALMAGVIRKTET